MLTLLSVGFNFQVCTVGSRLRLGYVYPCGLRFSSMFTLVVYTIPEGPATFLVMVYVYALFFYISGVDSAQPAVLL